MKGSIINRYLKWLQLGNPTGQVEKYPEISNKGETSLEGVYIVGDLTGIPLLKLASEGGASIVHQFTADPDFRSKGNLAEEIQDVIVVGAGPSGVAAALECEKEGLKYEILEASQLFNTIENFPKGKLILAKPDDYEAKSQLVIVDGHKESLLEDMKKQIAEKNLNLSAGTMVQQISRKEGFLELETSKGVKKAKRVILAIGKSGNSRPLKVPGEKLPKVFNRLFDPAEFKDREILVVGGGDSALEATIALAEAGNHVTHSYRKGSFARPKEENVVAFDKWTQEGRITPLFDSQVQEIHPETVVLTTKEGDKEIKNEAVFSLIGRELPLSFFKRSKIKMEGDRDASWYIFLVAMVSFFTMLYYGKAGFAVDFTAGTSSWGERIANYFIVPFQMLAQKSWGLQGYAWYSTLNFFLGWLGSLVWLGSGTAAFVVLLQRRKHYFGNTWNFIKYTYLTCVAIFFTWIYFSSILGQDAGWVKEPTYWYSFLYCTTMALFALRRAIVKKTRYIKLQMTSVVFIQVFFLFLLPYHLYQPLIESNFSPTSYIRAEMFPQGGWSAFGFILLWPLNINNFGTSTFWTWFPFVQTFGILFLLVWKFGKGAYCGWVCSCGGMAETLGDEYRTKSPHGPKAKSLENIGQFVLAFAFIATALYFAKTHLHFGNALVADTLWGVYKFSIDVFFAGVLGLGVYFFMGGRIWCRYGCPLAALMHIYTRFSKYRILSEKKKCISCNICTKVCHMGIDVMGFSSKGIPMNDAECVRCSTCVHSCPTQVLSFGEVKSDPYNKERKAVPDYGKEDWKAGVS